MTDEERMWLVVWGGLLGAGIVAETVALKTGKAHAPLSHWLRYLPLKGRAGQLVLAAAAWRFHKHLFPRRR